MFAVMQACFEEEAEGGDENRRSGYWSLRRQTDKIEILD